MRSRDVLGSRFAAIEVPRPVEILTWRLMGYFRGRVGGGVISRVTRVRAIRRPITPLIATHEPPSRVRPHSTCSRSEDSGFKVEEFRV